MSTLAWLVVAAVMAVIEVASLGLITVWFVVGGLAAFVAGELGADLFVQTAVFLAVSLLCLILLRPVFVKYRDRGKRAEPTVVGSHAVVREPVDNALMTGRVETPDHMTWAARSADGAPIPAGENVEVVGRESVTLIVERRRQ
ncbi:NfeD family protein [Rubneribacter sp.]